VDEESEDMPKITMVTSLAGSGDNGYNDLILVGVLRYYGNNSIRMSLQHPSSMDEARQIADDWIANTRDKEQSLLILGSDDYKGVIEGRDLNLSDNQRILSFECGEDGLSDRVSTFHIHRYGVSFLAGCMAHESPEAHVIVAMEDNDVLRSATSGFCEGYKYASGREAIIHYLAEDYKGYTMPNEAYNMCMDFTESFVYPLAGGSNNGVYKYSREDYFSTLLIAGMDADCAEYSTRIPFSVVIHIDEVVYDCLNEWVETGELPRHMDYGLSSGKVDIALSTTFAERLVAFQEYYADEDYWSNEYLKYKSLAVEKENEYGEE
jgi:basic membrane protein A